MDKIPSCLNRDFKYHHSVSLVVPQDYVPEQHFEVFCREYKNHISGGLGFLTQGNFPLVNALEPGREYHVDVLKVMERKRVHECCSHLIKNGGQLFGPRALLSVFQQERTALFQGLSLIASFDMFDCQGSEDDNTPEQSRSIPILVQGVDGKNPRIICADSKTLDCKDMGILAIYP